MRFILVDNIRRDIRAMFREYGMIADRWPTGKCPVCKKDTYFYGRRGLLYYLFNLKMPEGIANPSFRHLPNEADNCPLAVKEFKKAGNSICDPHDPVAAREATLSPLNLERTKAVLWHVLGCRNFSEEKVTDLLKQADKDGLWKYGFPSWATPYVLLLHGKIDYVFGSKRTHKVRFQLERHKKQLYIVMVYGDSGKRVNDCYKFPVSEQEADNCITAYRLALEKERAFRGPFRQKDMFTPLLGG